MPGSEGPAGSRFPSPITARRMALMQEPVLVLNATYEPINVTAVRRAMVLMLKGVAQAEELHNAEVHSAAHSHRVPSVIRLAGLPAYTAAESSAFAEKYFIARSQYLPVLRANFSQFGIDAGSCSAALERRALVVGESGGVLLPVQ